MKQLRVVTFVYLRADSSEGVKRECGRTLKHCSDRVEALYAPRANNTPHLNTVATFRHVILGRVSTVH